MAVFACVAFFVHFMTEKSFSVTSCIFHVLKEDLCKCYFFGSIVCSNFMMSVSVFVSVPVFVGLSLCNFSENLTLLQWRWVFRRTSFYFIKNVMSVFVVLSL